MRQPKVPVFRREVGGVTLSYLPQAPDHGRPELAVIRAGRVTVVAAGPEATRLWEEGTLEEILALEEAALREELAF